MKLMMFPKMLASHDEGWAWLMRVHPSVLRMTAFYVVPMSMLPPAMLLYAAHTFGDRMFGISIDRAWTLATLFYLSELVMVAVMAAVVQRIGAVADAHPAYHDAYAFAAVVPTPLWVSSLALFIPNPIFVALVAVAALFASAVLIYEGNYRVYGQHNDVEAQLLTASVMATGLAAWVAMIGLTLVSWGWAGA